MLDQFKELVGNSSWDPTVVNKLLRERSNFYDCNYLLRNQLNGDFIWGEIVYGPFERICTVASLGLVEIQNLQSLMDYVRQEVVSTIQVRDKQPKQSSFDFMN